MRFIETTDFEQLNPIHFVPEGEEYSSEGNGNINLTEAELAVLKLVELRFQLHEWMEMRELTIAKLREIADYIDVVSHRTGIAKVTLSTNYDLKGIDIVLF